MSSSNPKRSLSRPLSPFRIFRKLGFRSQLVWLLLFVLGATLLSYSVVLYRNFVGIQETEFDNALYNYTIDVAAAMDVNLFGEIIVSDEVFRQNSKIFPFALDKTLLQLRNSNGKLVAKSKELHSETIPLDQNTLDMVLAKKVTFFTRVFEINGKRGTYRVANFFIDRPGPFDFILQVASPMKLLERERRGLFAFFVLSIPITLLIAGLGSYSLASQATKPIDEIIGKAKAITARKLGERLPVPRARDEIRALSLTLNALLDRLEDAFQIQEAFVADASHQLKTPLAILKGEIEMMRKEDRPPAEVRAFFASAAEEVTSLSRMVEQLLLIARLEGGNADQLFQATRLDEIAIDVVSRLQKHARVHERGLRIQFDLRGGDAADYEVRGDFDLIRVLMENLVDNALKYTNPQTQVSVSLRDLGESVAFRVEDHGEGFDSADRDRLFQRFYRNTKTENRTQAEGSGLGLSIVKRIADLHHAQISVSSGAESRGAVIDVKFPKLS